MQIIRPSDDVRHRQRMIRRVNEAETIPSFYYALSHLWGISKRSRQHLWNDIGEYVNDENGQPVEPVFMRPEKRSTLLGLLKDRPDSYWWIDILCARTDTPLGIMGNIYACCLECIAMIDCEPGLISYIHAVWRRMHTTFQTENEPLDITYYTLHEYSEFYDLLIQLFQSKWWERVWTWQEMALPFGDVRLIAEAGMCRDKENDTMTIYHLYHWFANVIHDGLSHKRGTGAYYSKGRTVVSLISNIRKARNSNTLRIRKERSPRDFTF